MTGMIDEILSGRVFNRLANFSFRRKMPIESPHSSKASIKKTSQDSRTGRHTNKSQAECATTTRRSFALIGEHTVVASRSQEALQTQEHTTYPTSLPIQPCPVNAELEPIDGKRNLELDTKNRILLDQYKTSSSNAIENQLASPTSVQNPTLPVSVPTAEDDTVPEEDPLGLESMNKRDANGVVVPHEMIDNWNHNFHCVRKIQNRERRLNTLHEERLVANNMIDKIQNLLANGARKENLDGHLQNMVEVREQAIKNINRLQEKVFANRNELSRHEQSFLDNWEDFMRNNELIYVPSSASEGSIRSDEEEQEEEEEIPAEETNHEASNEPGQSYEPHESYGDCGSDQNMQQSPVEQTPYGSYGLEQDVQYLPIEPTPREINKTRLAGAGLIEEALEAFRAKGVRLADANALLEDWNIHCKDKLANFLLQREYPDIDTAQLQYDQELFIEKNAATRELIEAEQDLDESKAHYRALGVYLQADDQESQFQDQVDDGIETDGNGMRIVRVLNYGLIQRWLDSLDELNEECVDVENMDENNCQPQKEIDEEVFECWRDVPEVEMWESNSVYVVDAKRRKIDYWRSVCGDWPFKTNE